MPVAVISPLKVTHKDCTRDTGMSGISAASGQPYPTVRPRSRDQIGDRGDLHMSLPFSTDKFMRVMREYTLATWPSELVLTGLAIICLGLLFSKSRTATRVIYAVLAALWLWMAVAYHLRHFAAIN